MSATTTRKPRTARRPSTVTLPSLDGVTVAPEVAEVKEPEVTPEPTTPDPLTSANVAPVLAALHSPTARAIVTQEGALTLKADTLQIHRALRISEMLAQGATYKKVAETFALSGTGGAVKAPAILGAMLAPLGEGATLDDAHIIRKAARTLCPNAETLTTFLAGAGNLTGAEYVAHVVTLKAAADSAPKEKKKRAARPNDKGEGQNGRTGEGEAPEMIERKATPAEVLAEAARLITLAAHDKDGSLVEGVRAITRAILAYSDEFPHANPMASKKAPSKATAPSKPVVSVSA